MRLLIGTDVAVFVLRYADEILHPVGSNNLVELTALRNRQALNRIEPLE